MQITNCKLTEKVRIPQQLDGARPFNLHLSQLLNSEPKSLQPSLQKKMEICPQGTQEPFQVNYTSLDFQITKSAVGLSGYIVIEVEHSLSRPGHNFWPRPFPWL